MSLEHILTRRLWVDFAIRIKILFISVLAVMSSVRLGGALELVADFDSIEFDKLHTLIESDISLVYSYLLHFNILGAESVYWSYE